MFLLFSGDDEFSHQVEAQFGGVGGSMFTVLLGAFVLLFGALILFFGVMAMRGRRWGAICLAACAGLSVLTWVGELAAGSSSTTLGTAWSILSAVLLLLPRRSGGTGRGARRGERRSIGSRIGQARGEHERTPTR